MRGSEFIELVRHMSRLPDREEAIFAAVDAGHYLELALTRVGAIDVANDYLAIGEPDDFFRVPVGGRLGLRICERLGMRCPTMAEVIAIYHAADVKLPGRGMGPPWDASMFSIEREAAHDLETERDRRGRTGLIAGHRKDVLGVRARRPTDKPGRFDPVLAFGGLFDERGNVIQRDDGAHEPDYSDGSHGLRLVFDVDPDTQMSS